MVSQVGLNTAATNRSMPIAGLNNNSSINPASIFSTNGTSPMGNNYQNDIMMKNLNFGALAQSMGQNTAQNASDATQNSQIQSSAQNQQTSFGKTEDETKKAMAEYLKQNQSVQNESSQTPKPSYLGKLLGFVGGLLAPLAGKAVKLIQGGNFKDLFKLKELAISCPILGVVGLGVGMLVDSCIDANKANNIGSQNSQQQITMA